MWIHHDARISCVNLTALAAVAADKLSDGGDKIIPALVRRAPIDRCNRGNLSHAQPPQALVVVTREPGPVSLPVRQPQKVRLGVTENAFSHRVFHHYDRLALGRIASRNRSPGCNTNGHQGCPLSSLPIDGIASVVASREVYKNRRRPRSKLLNGYVPHKELPVILMGDDIGVAPTRTWVRY